MKLRTAIVEEADDFGVSDAGEEPCVVLEAERNARKEGEVGELAAESPDDGSGGAVDFVDGGGMPARDQVVVFGVTIDGVDVEIVKGIRTVMSGSKDEGRYW